LNIEDCRCKDSLSLATGLMATLGTTEAIWLFHFKQIIETG